MVENVQAKSLHHYFWYHLVENGAGTSNLFGLKSI
jgi:hypothetical protein